jgi:hypothetical protein
LRTPGPRLSHNAYWLASVFRNRIAKEERKTDAPGWSRKSERLIAHVPHGQWKTMTFLAALRCDAITAPCVFDGPINGESF